MTENDLHDQRGAVLDVAGGILRRGALHGDEHDEQLAAFERLRSGRCGVLGMHALQLASETPSALLDWNNNYGNDPNKAVCFHCSNLPKHFFNEREDGLPGDHRRNGGQAENTFGTCVGRVKAAPMSFARFSTDDAQARFAATSANGRFTDDPLETFGGAGVVEIPRLAAVAALYLRERLRAPCGRQLERDGDERSMKRPELSGLGYVLAR